jgi:hypothetical protein
MSVLSTKNVKELLNYINENNSDKASDKSDKQKAAIDRVTWSSDFE